MKHNLEMGDKPDYLTTSFSNDGKADRDGKILIRQGKHLMDPATGKTYTVAQANSRWKYRVVVPLDGRKLRTSEDNMKPLKTKML